MAAYLSQDLRIRVIRAIEGGMSRYAAAKRFGISSASAIRWMQTYLRHPGKTLWRRPPLRAYRSHADFVMATAPDITLANSEGALSASAASTSPSAPSTSSFGDTTSR